MKAIIFDLNGVILERIPPEQHLPQKLGIPAEKIMPRVNAARKAVKHPQSPPIAPEIEPFLREFNLSMSVEEFLEYWFAGESLVKGFLEYLQELKRKGWRIFILSNNFKERTEFYKKKIPELFETIEKAYFSWEIGSLKPFKEAFEHVLRENNLQPQECLFIDDSAENVARAKELGMKAFVHENLTNTKRFIAQYDKPQFL